MLGGIGAVDRLQIRGHRFALFPATKFKLARVKCTMQSCTWACGNTVSIACGKPFTPSTQVRIVNNSSYVDRTRASWALYERPPACNPAVENGVELLLEPRVTLHVTVAGVATETSVTGNGAVVVISRGVLMTLTFKPGLFCWARARNGNKTPKGAAESDQR